MNILIKDFDDYYELFKSDKLVYKTRYYSVQFFTYKILIVDGKNNWRSLIKNKLCYNLKRQIEIKDYQKNTILTSFKKNKFSNKNSFSINGISYTIIKLDSYLYDLYRNELNIGKFEYGYSKHYQYGYYNLTIINEDKSEDLLFYFNIFVAIIGRFYTD